MGIQKFMRRARRKRSSSATAASQVVAQAVVTTSAGPEYIRCPATSGRLATPTSARSVIGREVTFHVTRRVVTNAVRRWGGATVAAIGVAATVAFGNAGAQQVASPTTDVRPFTVGERLTYDVQFGPIKVGTGTMEVRGVENVRGREAYHTVFRINGGIPLYRVDDTFESWFATDDMSSLRFNQSQNEGQKERERRYEIFPERRTYDDSTDDKGEQPSVAEPLDDGSFVYFVRTLPLEVGRTYEFQRYFKPDRNPVTIRVLRRERIKVPAGTFDAIVIQPVIKTKGVFSADGHAELWLSDDEHRMILQMKSRLSIGSIDLYLTNVRRP
jgi:hypothetical protein